MTASEAPRPGSAEPKDDELHRRFREALDRKRNRGTVGTTGSSDDQSAKAHGTTGPAKQLRTFRRKSG